MGVETVAVWVILTITVPVATLIYLFWMNDDE